VAVNFAGVAELTGEIFRVDFGGVSWLYSAVILGTIPLMLLFAHAWPRCPYTIQFLSVALTSGAAWLRLSAVRMGSYWLCMASCFMCGLGASAFLSGPALHARWWMPPASRMLASSVMCQGLSFGWLVGVIVVPLTATDRAGMERLVWAQAAVGLLNVVQFFVFYRSPPAQGTGTSHEEDHDSMKPCSLFLQPQFWVRLLSLAVLGGVSFTVPAIQDGVLHTMYGFSDTEAAVQNAVFILSGVLLGVFVGAASSDRRMVGVWLKRLFVLAVVGSAGIAGLLWHTDFVRSNRTECFVLLLVCNAVAGGASLGFVGLGCQSMADFPVSESYSTGAMEVLLQLSGAILTQLASGGSGFVLCFAATVAAAAVFLMGHRDLEKIECRRFVAPRANDVLRQHGGRSEALCGPQP